MNDLAASSEVSRKARVDATPQAAGNYTHGKDSCFIVTLASDGVADGWR
jgi:hypothetical protein